jgi:zinc and cadmium transporter
MITPYLYAFLSVVAVSLVSLAGVFTLSLREAFLRKYIFILISLSVGALMGDAFIHLIPEALESFANPALASMLVIAGIMAFFAIEKFFHWHHHGEDVGQPHGVHPLGKLILLSDGIHNITDGIIIGASFLVSVPVGIASTLAVVLHEIPQEVGDFAVLLHAGYSRAKALWFNFLSALTALVGVLIAWMIGGAGESFNAWVLSLVAGGFIYIAIADLVPELHKTKEIKHSLAQIAVVIFGVLAMFALVFLE